MHRGEINLIDFVTFFATFSNFLYLFSKVFLITFVSLPLYCTFLEQMFLIITIENVLNSPVNAVNAEYERYSIMLRLLRTVKLEIRK